MDRVLCVLQVIAIFLADTLSDLYSVEYLSDTFRDTFCALLCMYIYYVFVCVVLSFVVVRVLSAHYRCCLTIEITRGSAASLTAEPH
jgi:hypothetical protein